MHHLYPSLKGDQLCPLGFHPQTRYPTRCKRCFRDYKEHGARRGADDVAASSPNLSNEQSSRPNSRTWTSTQNLSTANGSNNNDIVVHFNIELKKRPQSWASTPDIDESNEQNRTATDQFENNNVDVTVKLPVPPRRHTTTLDIQEVEKTLTQSRTSASPSKTLSIPDELVILSTDSLAERVRKMNLLKKIRSQSSRESSRERSLTKKDEESEPEAKAPPDRPERVKSAPSSTESKRSLPPKKTLNSTSSASIGTNSSSSTKPNTMPTSMPTIKEIKSNSSKNSTSSSSSLFATSNSSSNQKQAEQQKSRETQETGTLTKSNTREMQEEIKNLRSELEKMKSRAERAERDKSDILLRRLASMDTAPNRTAASEALTLQQKVNELKEHLDKVNEDKRKLNNRMKELESKGAEYELKRKLQAAEQICEELLEENQAHKKEILNLQAEMDELQDTFREDDVKAKTNLQKDLEKATKNCRILSFKLKKSERRIETLEQERHNSYNEELSSKVKRLEEELRFANDLTRKLQCEAEELRNPGKKKPPMLGVIGKSTSADGKITRESLTRGGSQEDPLKLQRELQDSIERETDLKDQLKFAEEEAENLRKKVARFEDENDSLMMQLKKMATRSRTRKLSPTPSRIAPEVQADRDEGISDEDDPAELRILLELNEQEASILRQKVEDLEKENSDIKKQVKELQAKFRQDINTKTLLSSSNASDKKLKVLNDELIQLKRSLLDKDRIIEKLKADTANKNKESQGGDVAALRSKIATLESENDKLLKENKLQQAHQKLTLNEKNNQNSNMEISKLKQALVSAEQERDNLVTNLKRMQLMADEILPPRNPRQITDLTPKNHLKRWVEELEDEINELRILVSNSGAHKLMSLEAEKRNLEEELQKLKQQLSAAEDNVQKLKKLNSSSSKASELELKLKKSEDESKKVNLKLKELEDKFKKQENQIKQTESQKTALEAQVKHDKEKLLSLEKDYEKERKEREKLENKVVHLDSELLQAKKSAEKSKSAFEKEIKELKTKTTGSKSDSKQIQELRNQLEVVQTSLNEEKKRYADLNTMWEKLSEETILMRAQLTTEKQNIQAELNATKQKLSEMETIRIERTDLAKKLNDAQKKIFQLESKNLKTGNNSELERTMLKNKLAEKEHEYERLRRENEMNIDLVFQLRKDNDDLNSKLNDFNRIELAQSNLNGHSDRMESEIKDLKMQLQNAELQLKSEVAATRLRYEQQVKVLGIELTSMQRQCERFKKDRDVFKQMLDVAQKKIADLKANSTGRLSRGSMHSSDDDDKSKITYLEQQIGNLEDQLVEARLEVSKVKTELVSERSANEIKISEMQSKLNEFEEERVIGSGRTKIAGMKTKLELSWQKEREDQQRLLQETSTLARDLRQTLFEVERERDKERLESKRKMDQIKRSSEEEMEEGRKKIAELQCDLLELRDVHAKLRTSNEKLRRERERYEKELVKRRMEQEGSERRVGGLLQAIDELVKISPELHSNKTIRSDQNTRRSRSPSPMSSSSQISVMLVRLTEASEELRKFQRITEDENERNRLRRGNLRRAASQENDPHGSTSSVASAAGSQRNSSRLSRTSANNSSLIRKSLSLDHSIQKDQNIWRQDDGSVSSMQSIDSELGGLVRDSSLDSRLDSRMSGGSTQSDIPRGPRKKKKGLMGKLRSLTKSSRNSGSEVSIQGSDSDISVASDMRSSKKDLRGRLSGMFKRSSSASRSESTERTHSEQRPVAVVVVGDSDGPQPREPPPANSLTPKPIRSISKPPTSSPMTPTTRRRLAK